MVYNWFGQLDHRTWILDQEVNATILVQNLGKWNINSHLIEMQAARSRPIVEQPACWRRITEWFLVCFGVYLVHRYAQLL